MNKDSNTIKNSDWIKIITIYVIDRKNLLKIESLHEIHLRDSNNIFKMAIFVYYIKLTQLILNQNHLIIANAKRTLIKRINFVRFA